MTIQLWQIRLGFAADITFRSHGLSAPHCSCRVRGLMLVAAPGMEIGLAEAEVAVSDGDFRCR